VDGGGVGEWGGEEGAEGRARNAILWFRARDASRRLKAPAVSLSRGRALRFHYFVALSEGIDFIVHSVAVYIRRYQ